MVAGLAVRLFLAVERPLWADETFTLEMARRGASEILAALRADSGPPLHYLLARVLLLPFPLPGPADLVVRLLSVGLALLHVPLLLAAGRRLGSAAAGLRAGALFSLMPLAAWYGSEGRGYEVASLLVLLAFERSLAARDAAGGEPGEGRGRSAAGAACAVGAVRPVVAAVVAGASAAGAFLCHYLALFPLAGIALSLLPASRRAARLHLLSGLTALLLVLPWLPVAFRQPRASMRWVIAVPAWEAAPRVLANALLGADGDGAAGALLGVAALLATILLVAGVRRGGRAAAATLAGLALLLLAGFCLPELLLPERCGVPFLPLAALALSSLPAASAVAPVAPVAAVAAVAAGAAGLLLTALSLRSWRAPTVSSDLAAQLLAVSRPGERIVAPGLWGPELRYRFARAGRRGDILLFPPEVSLHPGWYDDTAPAEGELLEAAAALGRETSPPAWWVLPRGARASRVLREESFRLGGRPAVATPLYEVWRLGGPPSSR